MVTQRSQRLRDLNLAMPRADSLLDSPRQRLDVLGDRLPAALIRGVQVRRVHLSDRAGSLRPGTVRRAVENETRRLTTLSARLGPALGRAVKNQKESFEARAARLQIRNLGVDIQRKSDAQTALSRRLSETGQRQIVTLRDRIEAVDRLRETLSYKATLGRGYAVVFGDGKVVTTKTDAVKAAGLEIEFADGRLALSAAQGTKTPRAKPKPSPEDQGSLF